MDAFQRKSTENLDNGCDVLAWRNLAFATLGSIILFNRRREGENSKLQLSDLENLRYGFVNQDVMGYLSKSKQQLCSSLKKVEMQGKPGRLVLLIITRKNEKAISYLMRYRRELVNEDNKYVFAVLNGDSLNQLRGNDAICKHVSQL